MMGISISRRRVAGIVHLEADCFFSHSVLHDRHSGLQRYGDLSLAILFASVGYYSKIAFKNSVLQAAEILGDSNG
jgi:hypothetical protein